MAINNKSIILGAVAEIDLRGEQIPLLLMISSDNKVFLVIGSRRFEFSQLSEGFKASYKNVKGDAFNISQLLGELIPSIANELPGNLKVNLEQVIIAYQKQDSSKFSNKPGQSKNNSTLLLSTRLGFDINLAELPLIGDKIPTEIDFKLKSFQLTYVSQALNKASVQPFAEDINLNIAHITNDEQIFLTSGLNLCAELQVGSETQLLSLPLSRPQKKTPSKSQQQPSKNPKSPVPSDSKIAPNKSTSLSTNFGSEQIELWLELNKAIGAIAFQKIGVQYRPKESELWFFLNASLSIAGLTLACNNLGVGSSLGEFKPKFRLDGISIHYSGSDTVEIGGAFLRKTRTGKDGTTYEEYSGAAIIGTKIKDKKITLTAIGSYTEIDGEASLFIFALLDYPLGGPPIFFVTGLAAGFGYNRTLKVPETVEDVADFPLVRLAMGEKPSKSSEKAGEPDLLSILDDLGPYIPPVRDEMFFAVGVKFTSFKTVEAFVLLIIKLGKKFEIHILGLATLTAPPMIEGVSDDIEPVAEARLAIKAVFIPDDGILKVEAVLAEGSYIFSRKCHLSGGFAFYTWFSGEHEGDFVLTLGGYHPDFKIPDHYPRVPPVKLSWQLNEYLFIKGSAYFALTPSALMVGGGLEASYQKGNVQACFKIEANFLVAWQPFFYTADISVEIRASAKIKFIFEKTISLNIRASLSIWGPPFAGRAQFEIGPISIEIAFGDGSYPKPKALSWSEFQKSLLPAPEKVCSISISEGLIKKLGEGKEEIWIVNAKELVIVTESAIPSLCVEIADIKQDSISDISHPNTEIGIRPMGVKAKEFEATYKISVFRDGTLVNQEFKYEPIYKNVPSAIWKASTGSVPYLPPEPNEEKLIKQALCGFEIQPGAKPISGETQKIAYEKLLSDCFNGSQYYWSQIYTPKSSENKDVISKNDVSSKAIMKLEQALEHQTNDKRRQNLLNSLNFNCEQKDITISKYFAEELLGAPSFISLF